jgi:hypothetical protein
MGVRKQSEMSRIPVAYLILGYENNHNTIVSLLRNSRVTVDTVIDSLQAVANTKMSWIPEEISRANQKGVKFRTITDITIDNLPHCKKIMARIDELRHLSGIGVNFVVTDTESIVMVPTFAPREEYKLQVIHTDSESVVEYKRLCFDMLWDKATPAPSRIKELERKDDGKSAPDREAKAVIDRIYACTECKQTFLYSIEIEGHRRTTGHESFREYPIV